MTAIPSTRPAPEPTCLSPNVASLRLRSRTLDVRESRIGDADWQQTADYINDCFYREFRARTHVHMPRLIGLRDEDDNILAAVGLRDARRGPLFLEQYLDDPVDRALSQRCNSEVQRRDIIEIGHLAGSGKGMSRFLFAALTALLTEWGYPWIAFTGTREVRCIFQRLNLSPVAIRPADPSRLPCGGADWGSYYSHDPMVMAGEVGGGHATLRDLGVYRMMNLTLNRGGHHEVA